MELYRYCQPDPCQTPLVLEKKMEKVHERFSSPPVSTNHKRRPSSTKCMWRGSMPRLVRCLNDRVRGAGQQDPHRQDMAEREGSSHSHAFEVLAGLFRMRVPLSLYQIMARRSLASLWCPTTNSSMKLLPMSTNCAYRRDKQVVQWHLPLEAFVRCIVRQMNLLSIHPRNAPPVIA